MGYQTRHKLTIFDNNIGWIELDELEEDDKIYAAIVSDEYMEYALIHGEPCKWYEHETDMREFSKRSPTTLFKLEGEGEEGGDLWIEYHKNGKMQRCNAIITFDEFDENKLAD